MSNDIEDAVIGRWFLDHPDARIHRNGDGTFSVFTTLNRWPGDGGWRMLSGPRTSPRAAVLEAMKGGEPSE
jgi:hypothetical protein